MRTEVPEVKRACFCFPLRYSLLLWGYAHLIYNIIVLCTKTELLTADINSILSDNLQVFILTLGLLDIIFVVIIIIGAHKKSVKLLKTFYFYGLGMIILQILLFIGSVIWIYYTLLSKYTLSELLPVSWPIVVFAATITSCLILDGYLMLLVRSEIIKLSNTRQFRFVNNAAESECTMKCELTGDEELGLDKSNEEAFESKDNCPENMGKLTSESEGNMKYKEFNEEENENISKEETSKLKYTCIEKGKLAKEPKRNMKYEKLGDELGL